VNEDLFGETAVYAAETLAHEIGHVLGALHDGVGPDPNSAPWYSQGTAKCDAEASIMASYGYHLVNI
jgi:hypothetical protein